MRTMYEGLEPLGLALHQQEKRFIGRIEKGFDLLGYHFHPSRKLRPSAENLRRLAVRYALGKLYSRWTLWFSVTGRWHEKALDLYTDDFTHQEKY